jgi:hypothetical protein
MGVRGSLFLESARNGRNTRIVQIHQEIFHRSPAIPKKAWLQIPDLRKLLFLQMGGYGQKETIVSL